MADLSTLDETQPEPTDPVGEGDDRIRETREAVKTSFAVEHNLNGIHALKSGTTSGRPAAGNAGRPYINTAADRLEFDSGAVWTLLNAIQFNGPFESGSVALTTSNVEVRSVSLSDVLTNSRVLLIGTIKLSNIAGVASSVLMAISQSGGAGGTPFPASQIAQMAVGDVVFVPICLGIASPGTGNITWSVKLNKGAAGATVLAQVHCVALAL